ncbi:MAG: cardiolipin synthase [Cocleimonas sp.]
MEILLSLDKITILWVFEAFVLLLGFSTAVHALLRKREPRASLLWITVCLFIPLLGPILYLLLGINRIHHLHNRGTVKTISQTSLLAHQKLDELEQHNIHYPNHVLLVSAVTGLPLCSGNKVAVLNNGEEAYPAMMDAINRANDWIYLCMYIFEHKGIGGEFIAALENANKRGVEIRVLLDGVGACYNFGRTRSLLREKGIKVAYFLPPRLIPPQLGINMRNHRKMLITDGNKGFIGGMNIRQSHLLNTSDSKHLTRDTLFCLQGPILKQICNVFEDDWLYAYGEVLPQKTFNILPNGLSWCRTIADGPGLQLDALINILIGAIGSAHMSIEIKTPYFLPPRELISALQSAALRGVEVTLLLPTHNNLPYVHWAMRHMLWQLLKYNIKVYYQAPPFDHSKLLVIDQRYCQVGSANMDARSLRLNFELTVEIYDEVLGMELSEYINHSKKNAKELSQELLDKRSFLIKIWDAFCWLFTPYL